MYRGTQSTEYPFNTFWLGGFECADQQNAFGNRVDLAKTSGHIQHAEEDYANLAALGIRTVREGIRWSVVEKTPYHYDFSDVKRLIRASKNSGIQIIWDICHFGFPDDLTPLHPMFARRFSHMCRAFAEFLDKMLPGEEVWLIPINEVSFLSWLGGDVRGTSPYTVGQGWDVKYFLMKAYIEGVTYLKTFHPNIRVLTSEPLISICAQDFTDTVAVLEAKNKHDNQYQMLDILTGRMCPELGGSPELLDVIGVNFYFNNQWINETHEFIPWGDVPPNRYWKPLSVLIKEVFLRYGKPIVITETGHVGEHRPDWLHQINHEVKLLLSQGIPLWGCCIYPIVDRQDWDFTEQWHHSGLWDIFNPETLERIPHAPSLEAVKTIVAETPTHSTNPGW